MLSVYLYRSGFLSRSRSHSIAIYFLFLSLSLAFSLSLSLSHMYLPLSLFLSLLSLAFSFSLSLSICIWLSRFLSLSRFICLSVCLSVPCFSLSVSVWMSVPACAVATLGSQRAFITTRQFWASLLAPGDVNESMLAYVIDGARKIP